MLMQQLIFMCIWTSSVWLDSQTSSGVCVCVSVQLESQQLISSQLTFPYPSILPPPSLPPPLSSFLYLVSRQQS